MTNDDGPMEMSFCWIFDIIICITTYIMMILARGNNSQACTTNKQILIPRVCFSLADRIQEGDWKGYENSCHKILAPVTKSEAKGQPHSTIIAPRCLHWKLLITRIQYFICSHSHNDQSRPPLPWIFSVRTYLVVIWILSWQLGTLPSMACR